MSEHPWRIVYNLQVDFRTLVNSTENSGLLEGRESIKKTKNLKTYGGKQQCKELALSSWQDNIYKTICMFSVCYVCFSTTSTHKQLPPRITTDVQNTHAQDEINHRRGRVINFSPVWYKPQQMHLTYSHVTVFAFAKRLNLFFPFWKESPFAITLLHPMTRNKFALVIWGLSELILGNVGRLGQSH